MQLFDILYIDFYFEELGDNFLSWVIDNYADRFTQTELAEMRAQADSHLDFYEIQKVIPGEGCYIKSLITSEEGFLKDVSSSSKMIKWDIVLTRCYFFSENYYATGTITRHSHLEKPFILAQIKKAWAEDGDSVYSDFAKTHWEIFFQIEKEIKKRALNKKYFTKYGELQLCEVRFRVNDVHTLLNKIKSFQEFNFIESSKRKNKNKKVSINRYKFDWLTLGIERELEALKTDNVEDGILYSIAQLDTKGKTMGIDVIGTLYLDKFLCRLETQSINLAEFAVSHFTRHFGEAVTFQRIIKLKTDQAPKQKESDIHEESEAQTIPSPELPLQFLEDYYLNLLDEKIPALNHLTPREARRIPHPCLC